MRIAIITNRNGIGLEVDAELLSDFLINRDHAVDIVQYDKPWEGNYDISIFLEVISEHLLSLAAVNWYMANPEWLLPKYGRLIQRHCQKVLAKTRDAEKVLRTRFANVEYTGFLSRDKRDQAVGRERRFLHLGGNSGFRNTPAVIEAWRSYRYWNGEGGADAELTVVSNSKMVEFTPTPGVTFIKRGTDEEIKRLQNSHLFHLMPSAYEGFGQALHESQSVGAVLLTTGEGPMAELHAPFEVLPTRKRRNNMGLLCEVGPQAIREKVPAMLAQPNHVIAKMQMEARLRWERGQAEAETALGALIRPRTARSAPRATLALLGNFGPPHSTENDLLWTLRDMGHTVINFQENEDRTEEILYTCIREKVKLWIFVHTHGWESPGDISVGTLIERLRAAGIKTAGFHLDRYWGLNALDKREDRIGLHPFWGVDAVFTADGGNQIRFRERLGVEKHHWLPPGVVRRDCYLGSAQNELSIDVGFVGATGYHPEYLFRGELIQFLHNSYGDRFRVFTGYRGERLNDLYASIRVVVGDSCFGGADRYWSDRVPETLGRGGLLIHPATPGLTIPGLVTYEPGNLDQLQDRIDWWLEHEEERQAAIKVSFAWAKDHETYHNRMKELLRVMEVQ